jgi:O-antigen/teichoic acid export membrane protein
MPTVTEDGSHTLVTDRAGVERRYVKAALHTGFGGVASRIFSGLAPIILARYLGPKEYGVYTLVLALVGMVSGASHLGQNTALQKFLPEYCVKDPRRGGAILADTVVLVSGILALVCGVFYFSSGWIASFIYHDQSLTGVFKFSALLVLFLSLFNLVLSAVAGLQDFKSYSKAMVIRSAGFFVLAWAGVLLLGLYGALGGQLLASVLGLAFLTGVAVKGARRRFPGVVKTAFSRNILREIFSFAFPAFLAGMLVGPAYWWANTLLARDAGFEQVGLFGVAFALCQLIMVIPLSISIPAVSFMSETHASSKQGEFSALVGANLRLVWAMTLTISLGCALFAPWIVRLLFGAAYRAAAPLAFIMSLVGLLMAINNVIGNAIAASGRMWYGFGVNCFWLVIFLFSCFVFIPRWGGAGLALSFAVSYLAFTVVVWQCSRWLLSIIYERLGLLTGLTLTAWGLSAGVRFVSGEFLGPVTAVILVLGLTVAEWKWVLTASERSAIAGILRQGRAIGEGCID